MPKVNWISRRTFLKMLAWLLALLSNFEINEIASGEARPAAVQATPYGRGAYGQGDYPSFKIYLPVITRGEK